MSLLHKHWKLIALLVVVGTVLGALLSVVQPRVFRSHMKLLVRTGREETVMASGQQTADASLRHVSEEDVNSEMELLRSHDLLEAVVRDCDLAPHLDGPDRQQRATELAVQKLYRNLEISAVRKTNVIDIAYYADSAAVAGSVLRDLNAKYLSLSIAAHGAPDSTRFFTDELEGSRRRMLLAQQQATDFRLASKIFDPAQQRTGLVGQLSSIRERLQDTIAQVTEQMSRRHALQSQSTGLPNRIATQEQTSVNKPLIENLEARLNDLKTNRILLSAKYKKDDALITTVDQQILNTTQQLNQISTPRVTDQTSDLNPLQQSIIAELSTNAVLIQALVTRENALRSEQATVLASLNDLDQKAVSLANLERTQSEAQNSYTLFDQRLEESRIATQMDQQKIANVAVVENPVASPIPISPSLRFDLLIGLCSGALLGFLISWLLETLRFNRVAREVSYV